MKDYNGKFNRYIMSFSFQKRRARALMKYRKRVRELDKMDTDEIDYEHIILKVKYEHKKSILTLVSISIALAVLMNIWSYFFFLLRKGLIGAVWNDKVREDGVVVPAARAADTKDVATIIHSFPFDKIDDAAPVSLVGTAGPFRAAERADFLFTGIPPQTVRKLISQGLSSPYSSYFSNELRYHSPLISKL